MMDDEQLLGAYARERSESAFGELVERHIDFVYSTALRVVNGDSHLAQDVSQTVFIDLARKAGSLPGDVGLAGWLHHHTCYTAAKAVRAERRRQTREQTAMEMRALDDNTRPEWELVAPYLDESLDQLNPADRDALVLRFLKQQDLRAVGEALGISDDAAQKRVDRALEKLHVLLKHRGATPTAAALGTALATEAVTAAPAGLAGSVAGAALASAAMRGGATATLVKLMTITKVKLGIISLIAVAGVATTLVIQQRARARLHLDNEAPRRQGKQLAKLATQNERPSNRGVPLTDVVYTVEGRIHYDNPARIKDSSDTAFTVCVSNCLWSITAIPLDGKGHTFKQVYDGEITTYAIKFPDESRKLSDVGNDAVLIIERNDMPNSEGPVGIGPTWLAYASACKFSVGKTGLLEPVSTIMPDLRKNRFTTPAIWETEPKRPFLPSRVHYFMDWDSFDHAIGRTSKSSEEGHLSPTVWALYRVAAFTNIGSLFLPNAFDFEVYDSPKSQKQKPVLVYKYHGMLIRAYEAIPTGGFDHGFGTKTFVQDERFITPANPVAFVRYATTNKTIPPANDPDTVRAASRAKLSQFSQDQPSSAFDKVQRWVRYELQRWPGLWRAVYAPTLPKPQGGANERQPSGSATNGTSAEDAPRRPP